MKKIFTFLLLLSAYVAGAQSTTIVISQVYGAGGNAGATLNADYVELHNISSSPQSLDGLSVQYSSATGSAWSGNYTLPAATIPAGGYFLIQMSAVGANGSPLPTPDAIAAPTIAMAAANGKVALVNGIAALSSCSDAEIIDLVGFGSANCSETSATPALSAVLAAFRINNGCTDTNDNSADFTTGLPSPRNSASPVSVCGAVVPDPSLTADPTSLSFGTITVGSASPSASFSLTGADLTGAPGNITITASSSDFEVSADNTNWGSTATVAYTSATLSATNVYVRFTPQSTGAISGQAAITGGGVATAVNVNLNGTGLSAGAPVLTATSLSAFGATCINQTVGPVAFDLSGSNLTTDDITVGPLAGFTFATSAGGTFTPTLTITQGGGSFNQTIHVIYLPTAIQNYSGNIPVSGGGATALNVAVSASGVNNTPALTTGAASAITTSSATLAGTITSIGCSAYTVYGIEYSLTSGFTSGTVVSSTNISGNDFTVDVTGLAPSTTYYYKSFATNAGGTGYGSERSFTTAAPPAPTVDATTLADFGNVCLNTTVGPNSFDLTVTNLSTGNITVGPLEGFTFSESATGTFSTQLTLTPTAGGYTGTIYVNFMPEVIGSYSGNIPVVAGSTTGSVPVTGAGNASGATVTTTNATVLNHHEAVLAGTVTGNTCGGLNIYGIEYSSIEGFIPGSGTKVQSSNIDGAGAFTATAANLIQNTTYYYRAYSTSAGITTYGDEATFTTNAIASGLVIYGNPVKAGTSLHFSLTNMRTGHYTVRFINQLGQTSFQHDLIIQVPFIDEHINIPASLPAGVYTMQIINANFRMEKQILIF